MGKTKKPKASPWVNGLHVANLKKLAKYLKALPDGYKHFDMGEFAICEEEGFIRDPGKVVKELEVCNTAACALGHGPSAGIAPTSKDNNWPDYCVHHFIESNSVHTKEWDWCFDATWEKTDNTPRGAGLRIEYMLKHGVPGDYYYQMHGHTPLSYLPKPKAAKRA